MVKVTKEQLEMLKQYELEILKEFIRVCDILNLKYYVIGGTRLGTVRHKGFIPWDDDIDVGMPREDYEIFISRAKEFLPENLFVQNIFTDYHYPRNFTKIRNSKTTFIEKAHRDLKINHGIFIDVFPLDYYVYKKHEKLYRFAKRLYDTRMYYEEIMDNNSTKAKIVGIILKSIFPSGRKVTEKRDKLYKSGENKDIIVSNCSGTKAKFGMPAEWYGDGVLMEFEDIVVNVPTEHDKYLTYIYGDYMKLPPEEQREGHHYVAAIDFNKSYTNYI